MRVKARLRALLVAGIALALAGCALPPRTEAGSPRIWDVAARRWIDEPTLAARLATPRFRLLGEVHDNPAHHELRARMLSAIAAAGKRPAVVMEQLDFGHEQALREAQQRGADADVVATAGGLDRRGWSWPLHRPIVAAALAAHLPIYAGNVPRDVLNAFVKSDDAASLDPAWRARIAHASWDEAKGRELAQDIAESHCGKLPEFLVPRLAFAQRARDAAMAEALVHDATTDGAVLIAGNGHVRGDLGVPAYLEEPAVNVVKVGWIEVSDADLASAAAPADLVAEHPGFDYLWLTRAVEREDPCRNMPDLPPARTPAPAKPPLTEATTR